MGSIIACRDYFIKKEFNAAITTCTEAIKSGKEKPYLYRLYFVRGLAYFEIDKYSESISDLSISIDLYPSEPKAYTVRGSSYSSLKKYDEAISDFTKAIELNPNDDLAYAERGMIELLRDHYNEAISDFTSAIKLDPNNYKHYYNRAAAYYHTKQADKFIEDNLKIIELNPGKIDAYYNLACIYSIKNNIAESCAWLQKAVKKGFPLDKVKEDKDLDNIRNTECYKEIILRTNPGIPYTESCS